MLSRRNIARIIAVIAAAILTFHTATAALSPSDEALSRKASITMCRALSFEDALPSGEASVAVSDHLFVEVTELFFRFRHLVTGGAASTTGTHIATPLPSFTAEDRRMLRRTHDMVKKLQQCDTANKPDRRSAEQRIWIDKAVRLYIQRHDIETATCATFSAACGRYWNRAKSHFKDRKQYQNFVRWDYLHFYDVEAEKARIMSGDVPVA